MIQHTLKTEQIEAFCANSPFGARCSFIDDCYSGIRGASDLWAVKTEKGDLCGVAARNGSDFILHLTTQCDFNELEDFLYAVGAKNVLCGELLPPMPEFKRKKTGSVMEYTNPTETIAETDAQINRTPNLKSVYKLLEQCAGDSMMLPEFSDFYIDMSHKTRHGLSRIIAFEIDDKPIAFAMTVAESASAGIIGAVAVAPASRKKGLGGILVSALALDLKKEGKRVYVFRAINENQSFYDKLGFKDSESWTEYTLN